MLTHVALFRFVEGTTDEAITALEEGLGRLPSRIPGVRGYAFGRDLSLVEGTADFAVVAHFDDAEAYRTYADHPEHLEVSANLVRPILAELTRVQFEG